MIPQATPMISNTWPFCTGNTVSSLPGYTAMCVDGTAPACTNGVMSCKDATAGWGTGNPVFVNDKYASAL